MTQAEINAIRTLAQRAISLYDDTTKKLGRKPTNQEVTALWADIRSKVKTLTNGRMGLVEFNVEIRKVATGK